MSRRGIAARAVLGSAIVLAIVLVLASGRSAARALALTPAHTGQALAALELLKPEVDIRRVPEGDWRRAIDGEALDDGMGVQTDANGFAQLTFADGSLARLSPRTIFEVVRLDGEALAPTITARLDLGRVWNRVQHVTGARGGYEIETAVGTAAVRGTTFVVECDDRPVCTFTVIDGVIEITAVDGQIFRVEVGEELTLGLDDLPDIAIGPTGPIPPAGIPDPADPSAPSPSPSPAPSPTSTPTGEATAGESETEAPAPTLPPPSTSLWTVPVPAPSPTESATPEPASPREPTTRPVLVLEQSTPGREAVIARSFVAQNLAEDAAAGRDEIGGQDCQVTVAGRSAVLASTPQTAIDVAADDEVAIVALATGDLDEYRVDVTLGGVSFLAGSGSVEPDSNGERASFRGTVDVADYARWGSGLYRVDAVTTGTACAVTTFVNVTGGAPLLTLPGIGALLLLLAGMAGLAGSLSLLWSATAAERDLGVRR